MAKQFVKNKSVKIQEVLLLWSNMGRLSLMSLRVMLTVVVPASPPSWPPMSLACMTTV